MVDPEEDFDGFMDTLPSSTRTKILKHMRGETPELEYSHDRISELEIAIYQAMLDGDTEAREQATKELRRIAGVPEPTYRPCDSGP